MKKLLFSLLAVLVSLNVMAQKEDDKVIVNLKNGQKKEIFSVLDAADLCDLCGDLGGRSVGVPAAGAGICLLPGEEPGSVFRQQCVSSGCNRGWCRSWRNDAGRGIGAV